MIKLLYNPRVNKVFNSIQFNSKTRMEHLMVYENIKANYPTL